MSQTPDKLSRRRIFAGAGSLGALGAAAAAAAVLAPAAPPARLAQDAATPPGGADKSRGYQATAHVQRYYETAKV